MKTPKTPSTMNDLLTKIEHALDTCPLYSRKLSPSAHPYEAELVYTRGGWIARCYVRVVVAKGPGSKSRHLLTGDGATPEAATATFLRWNIERPPRFTPGVE